MLLHWERIPFKLLLQPGAHTASNPTSCHGNRLCLCHWTRLCRSNVIPPHKHGAAVLGTLHATKQSLLAVTITGLAQPLANQGPSSICTPCRHQQVGSSGDDTSLTFKHMQHTGATSMTRTNAVPHKLHGRSASPTRATSRTHTRWLSTMCKPWTKSSMPWPPM
jgi:hypothetical protein